jgi:N-glycosylase/DNA lyase
MMSHGWINLSPFSRNADGFSYSFSLSEELPITISIKTSRKAVECYADISLTKIEREKLSRHLNRILSLDFPLKSFQELCLQKGERAIHTLAKKGWGRMLRAATPWEDAVKTLLTTNASWPYTVRMCQDLVQTVGKTTSNGCRTFPTARQLIRFLKTGDTTGLRLGYRIVYLTCLMEKALRTDSWLNEPRLKIPQGELSKRISKWKGFGPYAASHILMLMGLHSYLPVDREVARYLKITSSLPRVGLNKLDHLSDWGDFRFTAYKLFRVLKKENWIGG